MKNIIIITGLMICFACKAQSPILPLEDWYEEEPNAYYKDIDNDLNSFEGTWLYTNGTTSLKIILSKEVMYFNDFYYEDLITGEYQYIEDGIEVINTLTSLGSSVGYESAINGNHISKDCNFLPSSDCIDGENRLRVSLTDPMTGHVATTILHKRIINGQEAILAYVIFNQLVNYDGSSLPEPEPNMPWQQEYIMIKQ
ncbi:DUF6705 family protein [Psychroserpens mesophilus]|uniref:DUF6705 family protein n=1 Tax=Psychroserpens mesophilus TaxID=325473 RepID=UPI003D653470